MRVPRGEKSIGFVFSLIENKRESYKISEYSASQTTLEQIFQTFANLKIDEAEGLKFHKVNGIMKLMTSKDHAHNLHIEEDSSKKPLKGKGKKEISNF